MQIIDFGAIGEYTLALLPYVPITLAISVFATLLGTVIGLAMALIKMARVPVLSQVNAVLVSYLRGTPILVQLLLNVNAVPIAILYLNHQFGTELSPVALSPFLVAGLTFALNEAAYSSESIRAALSAVDRREIEAGQSLGMTPVADAAAHHDSGRLRDRVSDPREPLHRHAQAVVARVRRLARRGHGLRQDHRWSRLPILRGVSRDRDHLLGAHRARRADCPHR